MRTLIISILLAVPLTGIRAQTTLDPSMIKGASDYRSLRDRLDDVINVKDYGAKGDAEFVGTTDDTGAFRAAHDAALAAKKAVYVPAGRYRLTSRLDWSKDVSLIGEAKAWWSNSPITFLSGTLLIKAHDDDAIRIIGTGAYSGGGTLAHFTIYGDKANHPTGNGIVLDQVGSWRLQDLNVIWVAGDSYVIGRSIGDATGQVYLTDCYSNGSGGAAFRVRAKWVRMSSVVSDGGTHGLVMVESPESVVHDFHFEGASTAGVSLDASGHTLLSKGYINGYTASRAIIFENSSGSYMDTVEDVHIAGTPAGYSKAIEIKGRQVLGTKLSRVTIEGAPTGWAVGVDDLGDGTTVADCSFYNNALDIRSDAVGTTYRGNRMDGTTGPFSIEHVGGTTGLWSGNALSKPVGPTATGVAGSFSGIIVRDNLGYRTRASGITAAIAPYTAIPHGLVAEPTTVQVSTTSSGVTSVPQVASSSAGHFTIYWTGTNPAQWMWTANLPCDP